MSADAAPPMDALVTTEDEFLRRFGMAQRVPPVVAYIRVSSTKQARDGLGLEGQLAAIREHCAARKLGEPVIVSEVGSAGQPLLNVTLPGASEALTEAEPDARPLLTLLLATLSDRERAKGTVFVLWKLDRLARLSEEQELLLRLLWRAEVVVQSTWTSEEGLLTGTGHVDPGRVLMRQIYSAFAQYERHLITARSAMGTRAKAASGQWTTGIPPFGYELHNRDIRIAPDKAPLVVAAYCLHRQGRSIRGCREDLEARYGVRMSSSRLHRILTNKSFYEGVLPDPYGGRHARPDLRILPADWDRWGPERDIDFLLNLKDTHEHAPAQR